MIRIAFGRRAATAMCAALTVAAGVAPGIAAAAPTVASHRHHPAVRASAHHRLNPARNIALPQAVYGAACSSHPVLARCTRVMLRALDHARSVMNESAYRVPSRFSSMRPQEQLLVLSNLDRSVYHRTPITGLAPKLSRSAHRGARADEDPNFVYRVNGAQLIGGGSNWAGGSPPMGSPLFAYYLWMYDDGPGSGNIDCQKKGDPGCWGHRDDTLFAAPAGSQVEMGVGSAKPRGLFSWTELYESFRKSATIPCVPTISGLSHHRGPRAGGRVVVQGFGFVQVRSVHVLGAAARITKRSPTSLTIRIPSHRAGHGFVQVTTAAGTSPHTHAGAYTYTS